MFGELLIEIQSVADMDADRAALVGRAFDVDPELRPVRVGGDPARIRVEPSLEALVRRTGLPIDWLTVRTNSRRDGLECGEITLHAGRGGFVGMPGPDGAMQYSLLPHVTRAAFLRSWVDAGADHADRIAALFVRVCDAMDACYGVASELVPGRRGPPPVDVGIGEVGWLNGFGPAYLERWPALGDLPAAARLANGGVVIRTGVTPWELDDAARRSIVDAIGPEAFRGEQGPYLRRGVRVPGYEHHMRFSPGTEVMPWETWLASRDAAKAERARERRYDSACRRRDVALASRERPALPARDAEWSSSFDVEDWRSFGRRLFRTLGGELAGPLHRALIDEATNAPVGTETSLVVDTALGVIELSWRVDDADTVDVYLFGPPELPPVIDAEYAAWSAVLR